MVKAKKSKSMATEVQKELFTSNLPLDIAPTPTITMPIEDTSIIIRVQDTEEPVSQAIVPHEAVVQDVIPHEGVVQEIIANEVTVQEPLLLEANPVEVEREANVDLEMPLPENVSAVESTNSAVSDAEISQLKEANPLAALKLLLSLSSNSPTMTVSDSTGSLQSINQESTDGLLNQLKAKVLEGDLVAKIRQSSAEYFEIKDLLQKLHKSKPDPTLFAFLLEFGPFFEQLCSNITKHAHASTHRDQVAQLHQAETNSLQTLQSNIDNLEAEEIKAQQDLLQCDEEIQRYREEIKLLQVKLANAESQKKKIEESLGDSMMSKKQAEAIEALKHLESANQHQTTIIRLDEELGYLNDSITLSVGILNRLQNVLKTM